MIQVLQQFDLLPCSELIDWQVAADYVEECLGDEVLAANLREGSYKLITKFNQDYSRGCGYGYGGGYGHSYGGGGGYGYG